MQCCCVPGLSLSSWSGLTAMLCLQEIYCFVLPFILKWTVAAMVASVLVNLFSKLTDQGDKSQMHIHDRIQVMIAEQWQHHFQHVPSNSELLLMLLCWENTHQSLMLLPSFVRYALVLMHGNIHTADVAPCQCTCPQQVTLVLLYC